MDQKINSSKGSTSVIIVVVLAIIIVLAGIYFYKKSSTSPTYSAPTTNQAITPTSPPTGSQPLPQSQSSSPSDDSDANINQELQTAGTNLNNLDQTSSNIDSSMNQQQVDPTQ